MSGVLKACTAKNGHGETRRAHERSAYHKSEEIKREKKINVVHIGGRNEA